MKLPPPTIAVEADIDMDILRRLLALAERDGLTFDEMIARALSAYVEWRAAETEKAA
jgi:hypothetical protein